MVAVGTAITGRPPHRSPRAALPHEALISDEWRQSELWGMDGAHAVAEANDCQTLHPCPIQMMPLATMNQHRPPEPHQPISESMQAVGVSRYRVVVEVALHDRSEPFACERNRIMRAVTKLLLEFQQLGLHPLADCLTLYRKVPVPVLPADVREAQKIKRFRLTLPSSFPVLFGKSPELAIRRVLSGCSSSPNFRSRFPK